MGLKHWERDEALVGIPVGMCECGHHAYEHGRRKPPSSPLWELRACKAADCGCTLYQSLDKTKWPYGIGP